MNERKKPGPHPEKPLEYELKARADKETVEELEQCQKLLHASRSEVLRQGIHCLFGQLTKHNP